MTKKACKDSFRLLKEALLDPNCARAMPDFDRAAKADYDDHEDIMTLWCDASDIGWGAAYHKEASWLQLMDGH